MKNYHKYLPITKTDKEWGFYIITVGYSHINPNQPYPPQKGHPKTHVFTWDKGRILNGYYVVYISKGQGVFESALTNPRIISEGTCFFLFPNVWHRYKPDTKTGWEEYWVGFNGPYPDHIMNKTFFTPQNPFIDVGLNENLLVLFQRLLTTVQNATPGYNQIISGITLEILGLLHTISIFKNQIEDEDKLLIHKSIFILRESLESPINMQKLVRELPMGYSKFRKLFKSETGYSPHQYLLNLRINKAKELLQTTELSIKQIAYQTGFESEFYFSRIFKKKVGKAPSDFRPKKF
ncbi:MAG: AraC family transcriptional regulator [Acidobacterium ailaaui]|nr:AraC family transcriptional regulator [Pseudacidobacterium ailaaui]